MSKNCIATMAVGDMFSKMASVTHPRIKRYAEVYGADFVDASNDLKGGTRPISWHKVPLLKDLLHTYDTVLWIDSDVFIAEMWPIPFDCRAWQGLVIHQVNGGGHVPNCGVWLLRPKMIDVLDRMWGMVQYINHCNWEQAALIRLMGGFPDNIAKGPLPTWPAYGGLDTVTQWLPYSFNTHPNDVRRVGPGHAFYHATMYPDRLRQLQQWEEMYGRL